MKTTAVGFMKIYTICRRESKRHNSITSICLSSSISHTHHSLDFDKTGACGASCVHRDILTFSKLLPRGRHCKHKSKLISKKPCLRLLTRFSAALGKCQILSKCFPMRVVKIENTSDGLAAPPADNGCEAERRAVATISSIDLVFNQNGLP